jgi:hypothetical protein
MTPMNTIQRAFSSPRMNRLMLGVGTSALAAGAVLFTFAFVGGSDNTPTGPAPGFRPTLPEATVPLKNADGRTVRAYRQLDPEIRSTIRTFIATAVARKHLGDSWDVVAPSLKAGYTFAQWKNAKALPVIPYPLDDINKVQYALELATTQEILIEVGVGARPETGVRPGTFQIGLIPVGTGANPQWLVDYWMPRWTPILPIN